MFLNRCLLLLLVFFVPLLTGCEKRDWEKAQAADSSSAYEHFLEVHPEGQFSEKARSRLDALREPAEWGAAKASGSQGHLRLFLEKYPSGHYASSARQELVRFEKEDQASWKKASQKDSAEAYRSYLENHPESRHAIEARQRLESLEEEADWKRVVAAGGIGYQEYLDKHPEGRHSEQAREKLEKLRQTTVQRVDEAFARMRRSVELVSTIEKLQGEERMRAATELIFLVGALRADIIFFETYASPDDPRREAVTALKQVLDKAEAK
jgi:hypothetical protein